MLTPRSSGSTDHRRQESLPLDDGPPHGSQEPGTLQNGPTFSWRKRVSKFWEDWVKVTHRGSITTMHIWTFMVRGSNYDSARLLLYEKHQFQELLTCSVLHISVGVIRNKPTFHVEFSEVRISVVAITLYAWLSLDPLTFRSVPTVTEYVTRSTSSQGTFFALFKCDHSKVEELDELVTNKAGFESFYTISSQTYSRKIDLDVCNSLGSFGATVSEISWIWCRLLAGLSLYSLDPVPCLNSIPRSTV